MKRPTPFIPLPRGGARQSSRSGKALLWYHLSLRGTKQSKLKLQMELVPFELIVKQAGTVGIGLISGTEKAKLLM